ncbi:MAG: penicillin-binding protein activator [Pseudomonadota bacterium]
MKGLSKDRTRPSRRALAKRVIAASVVSCLGGCAGGVRPGASASVSRRATPALLLPLSGDMAELAGTMAKSAWLAGDTSGAGQKVSTYDTGGTPEGAAAAARQAVAEGASVIVGPLFARETLPVVQAGAGVPVITLSNDEMLAETGAYVFGISPRQSAETMLEFARSSGARRIGVVVPEGRFGSRVAGAVAGAARAARLAAGQSVSAAVAPGQLLASLRAASGGRLPDIVYLPFAGGPLPAIATVLRQAGIKLCGSAQWAASAPLDIPALEGTCFPGPDPARFARLSGAMAERFDARVGILAGLAADAVSFAATVEAGRGGATLARRKTFAGVLGDFRFARDRLCQRKLAILRVGESAVEVVG